MTGYRKIYEDFLGTWCLMPETCRYEQSEPPAAGSYEVHETTSGLTFVMAWTDAEGEAHRYSFSAVPDGEQHPFNGGELADALSVTAVSATELNSAAYLKGHALMTATRHLVEDGLYMEIRQTVHLPDGTAPTNYSKYRRQLDG